MMQYMNQWLLSLQEGIKTIKYWNYRLDEHGIHLANRLFECLYQPLFSTRFFIWVVFSRVIINETENMIPKIPIKHFLRVNCLVET